MLRPFPCVALLLLFVPSAPAGSFEMPHEDMLPVLAQVEMPSAPPACASENAFRVLYVLAPATLDLFDARASQIEAGIAAANAVVLESSLPHGIDIRLRFFCDDEGQVMITKVRVPTVALAAHFGTIVSDLRAQGYDREDTKYWVVYEATNSRCGGCAGQGQFWHDDRATADNANNQGAMYAITYLGNFGAQANTATLSNVMLHEASHTMGAVQSSAAHASGGGHCNDGIDVMCYADAGPTGAFDANVCPRLVVTWVGPEMPYDCGQDDYFHPAPAPESYLATHWNLASGLNRWMTQRSLT